MKKCFLPAVALLSFATLFTSCKMNVLKGSGAAGTLNPEVASFNAIEVHLPLRVDVNVQPGARPGIQFSGYQNVIDHIKAKVHDNRLIIQTDLNQTWTIDGTGITVLVTLPALTAVELHGSPEAFIRGNVIGHSLDVNASGASKISIESVTTDTLDIEITGSGDIEVKGGAVKYAEYEIAGAGDVRAFALQTDETSISISGAGECELTATQKIDARISGAGSIKYKGHPIITRHISGASTIKDAN